MEEGSREIEEVSCHQFYTSFAKSWPGGAALIFHRLLSSGKSTHMHRSVWALGVQHGRRRV